MGSSQEGGPPPPLKTQAQITLQQLLDRQLSTTGRLELVDFKEATEIMRCIGHESAGVASLAEFREHSLQQRQADEKAWTLRDSLQSKGLSDSEIKDHLQKICGGDNASALCGRADKAVVKRKSYGVHPDFLRDVEAQQQQLLELGREPKNNSERGLPKYRRHAAELEASLSGRADRPPNGFPAQRFNLYWVPLCANEGEGSEMAVMGSRKPLMEYEQSKLYMGITPQERARLTEEDGPRTVAEVFASPAPPVLDMYTYLEQRQEEALLSSCTASQPMNVMESISSPNCNIQEVEREEWNNGAGEVCVREIPEQEIQANRLSEDEIRQLPGGKFSKYAAGCPSNTLYLKNLRPDVMESELVAIFTRFERRGGSKLIFRLMHRGRMKGQGFVTFPDKETAGEALRLANGYVLKGKPLVIEYARGAKAPSPSLSKDFSEPPPIRSRRKRPTKVKDAT